MTSVYGMPYHPFESFPLQNLHQNVPLKVMMDGCSDISGAYRCKLNVTDCNAGTVEGPQRNESHQKIVTRPTNKKKQLTNCQSGHFGTLLPTIAVCALVWGMMTRLLHGSCNVLNESSLMREKISVRDAV